MTRTVRTVAASLVVALLAAACGVPTSTGVRVDGPPEEPGAPGVGGVRALPPGPEEAETPEQLVEFYLRAAAADPENPAEALKEFIHPDERDAWQPPEDIYVARIADDPPRTFGDPIQFDLTVQRIGRLSAYGIVEPLSYEPEVISLYVRSGRAANQGDVRAAGERYWIVDPREDYILLDDQALDNHFQARPIYFWDQQQEQLVPDLRWLPNSLSRPARSQKVLEWLLEGPASWLESAVREVADVAQQGNVVPDEGTLEVPLTATSGEVDRPALLAQLWWSLRPDLAEGGIDVTVVLNDEQIPLNGDYGSLNPIPEEIPASFAIVDGTIVPYLPPDAESPQVLQEREDFNQGVVRAGLSRDGRFAAVVRQLADGRYRLDLAGPDGTVRTRLTAQAMSRPVWLNHPGGVGLIAADGALHSFSSGAAAVARVELPNLTDISGVAAAPDGHRLALVAGGQLYLASMARTGEGGQQILRSRWIPTSASDLNGVAFTRENRLAVIGAGAEERELYELTVDGALEQYLGGLGSSAVSDVVAFPVHPVREASADISIMYEADGRTYRYTRVDPVPVDAGDLLEDPPDGATVLAPFYLD